MEQNFSNEMPTASAVNNNKSSSGKGWKIATVIVAVLAVGGIGFGVYGMMQSAQKDSQISDLKVQIKEEDGAVTTIETPEIETTVEEGTVVTVTDTVKVSGGPYIENGVFYVPEWGLKFNIPSDLANYGYSVDYDASHVGYTLPEIGFTAMLKSDERQNPQAAYYDNIQSCSIVSVSKETGTWPSDKTINGLVKQFDDYALLIWNHSGRGDCSYNLNIDQVQEKIQTMFSNPEKI